MRNCWWHVARGPPSLGVLLPLAVAMLMLGSVESDSSALKLFQPLRRCPAHKPVETPVLEWTACPDRCSCSSEDVQLSCQGPNLPDLSDAGAVDLRRMVVQGVGIRRLQAKHFHGFNNLQFLALINGRIFEIDEDAFMDLPFLIHLDLSGNQIVEIPVYAFAHNKNLVSLNLGRNPLHVPSSGPLLRSESLQTLEMRESGISSVNSQTFTGTPLLSEIFMEDNPMKEFPSEAISGLKRLCAIRPPMTKTSSDSSDEGSLGIYILMFVSGGLLVALLIGLYRYRRTCMRLCRRNQRKAVQERPLSASEHRSSSGFLETQGPPDKEIDYRTMGNVRGGGYHSLNQSDMGPPALVYPGRVYVRDDVSGVHSSQNYALYVRASNYHCRAAMLPPPLYEIIDSDKLPSRSESVSTSATDLRTPVVSDVNVRTVNINNDIEKANTEETVGECSRAAK